MTSHLQLIPNTAALVILRILMSPIITTDQRSHSCLHVKVRSTYKTASLCFHCHNRTAPSYVTDTQQKKPTHSRSSSHTMPLLNGHAHSKATLVDRLFSYASSIFDYVPNDFMCAPFLSSFNSCLKTYLFLLFRKTEHSLWSLYICSWLCHVIDFLAVFLTDTLMWIKRNKIQLNCISILCPLKCSYIMLAYLMLFTVLFIAICLHTACLFVFVFFALDLCIVFIISNASCFLS